MGITGYLENIAREHPAVMCGMLARLVPIQQESPQTVDVTYHRATWALPNSNVLVDPMCSDFETRRGEPAGRVKRAQDLARRSADLQRGH
jgi:hypothetical protein